MAYATLAGVIMSLKLARDARSSVLQVGSYGTKDFINIDGSTPTNLYAYDTIVRIQSFTNDNWITINKFSSTPMTSLDVNLNGVLLFAPSYDGTKWIGPATGWTVKVTAGVWECVMDDVIFTAPINGANPPESGWTYQTGAGGADSIITVSYNFDTGSYYDADAAAVDGEGMLLPIGSEITMLLYKYDSIATIGGELNIVPLQN